MHVEVLRVKRKFHWEVGKKSHQFISAFAAMSRRRIYKLRNIRSGEGFFLWKNNNPKASLFFRCSVCQTKTYFRLAPSILLFVLYFRAAVLRSLSADQKQRIWREKGNERERNLINWAEIIRFFSDSWSSTWISSYELQIAFGLFCHNFLHIFYSPCW